MSEFAIAPPDGTIRIITACALSVVLGAMGATALAEVAS